MTVRLREVIATVPPYAQGRPAPEGGFKLSSNENPFPPLPAVVEAVQREALTVNRYPAPGAPTLRRELAERLGFAPDQVLIGDGSASLIQQLVNAVAGPGDEVVYAWRSFDAYPLFVRVAGATAVEVPLTATHHHDIDGMIAALTERTRCVLVCSPNNPTGTIVDPADLDRLLAAVPDDVLVVIDEAYVEFVTEPTIDALELARRHDNVVVLRTFSKAYGLAAVRVGYAVGDPAVLRGIDVAGVPLSVTALATSAALASLEHQGEIFARVERLAAQRDALWQRLADAGVDVPKPHGNFFWAPHSASARDAVHDILERERIVGKVFDSGTRLSVGEPEADDRIVAAISAIVQLPQGTDAADTDSADTEASARA